MSVLEAIHNLRREFLRLGLENPDVILLHSAEQGRALESMLVHEMGGSFYVPRKPPRVVEHPDGSIWVEMQVMDIKIRWPAQRLATRDGRYQWR